MPSRRELNRAIRYLLQLAVELENGADGEDRAAVLARVVEELERHRIIREQRKLRVRLAELVPLIMRRFELEDRKEDFTLRSVTVGRIVTWLRDRGLHLDASKVEALLARRPRAAANTRSQRERLIDQLASLVGTSQSDLEKLVLAIGRGGDGDGPLGTEAARQKAAMDEAPPTSALFEYVVAELGIVPMAPYDLEREALWAFAEAKPFAKKMVDRAHEAMTATRSRTSTTRSTEGSVGTARKASKKTLRRSR